MRGWNCSILFLSETKAGEQWMKDVARMIGFQNLVTIGLKGRACGICLLWSNNLDVEILEFNSHLIAIQIRDCNVCWSFVGFYDSSFGLIFMLCWCLFKDLGSVAVIFML